MKPVPLVFKSAGIRPRFKLLGSYVPVADDNVKVIESYITWC